jgi:hypothetical protein
MVVREEHRLKTTGARRRLVFLGRQSRANFSDHGHYRHGNLALGLRVFCFDATTGRVAEDAEILATAGLPTQPLRQLNPPASAAPGVQGERLSVYFGHRGAACLDHAGKSFGATNGSVAIRWPTTAVRDPCRWAADLRRRVRDRALRHGPRPTHRKNPLEVPRELPAKMKFSSVTPLAIEVAGRTQVVIRGNHPVAALDTAGRPFPSPIQFPDSPHPETSFGRDRKKPPAERS